MQEVDLEHGGEKEYVSRVQEHKGQRTADCRCWWIFPRTQIITVLLNQSAPAQLIPLLEKKKRKKRSFPPPFIIPNNPDDKTTPLFVLTCQLISFGKEWPGKHFFFFTTSNNPDWTERDGEWGQ